MTGGSSSFKSKLFTIGNASASIAVAIRASGKGRTIVRKPALSYTHSTNSQAYPKIEYSKWKNKKRKTPLTDEQNNGLDTSVRMVLKEVSFVF